MSFLYREAGRVLQGVEDGKASLKTLTLGNSRSGVGGGKSGDKDGPKRKVSIALFCRGALCFGRDTLAVARFTWDVFSRAGGVARACAGSSMRPTPRHELGVTQKRVLQFTVAS